MEQEGAENGECVIRTRNPLREAQFKQYLETKGLNKVLTEVLITFYEQTDHPNDPIEYVKDYFSKLGGVDINEINFENNELQKQIEERKKKLEELNVEIANM